MPRLQTLRITSTSPNYPQRPFTQRTARTSERSRRSSVLCSRFSRAALVTAVRGRNFTLITPDVLGYEREEACVQPRQRGFTTSCTRSTLAPRPNMLLCVRHHPLSQRAPAGRGQRPSHQRQGGLEQTRVARIFTAQRDGDASPCRMKGSRTRYSRPNIY